MHPTRWRGYALVLLIAPWPFPDRAHPQTEDARALVTRSIEAMGGAARLEAIGSIRVTGVGHEHALEQSERPEGPWLPTYRQFTELRDIDGRRLRRNVDTRGFWAEQWQPLALIADAEVAAMGRGGRWFPAPASMRSDAMAAIDLAPERILLTARAAGDLRLERDTVLQGVTHDIVAFTYDGRPVRLFVNRNTRLPAGYAAPAASGDMFAEIFGDEPQTVLWSLWSLEPGGQLYPRQIDRQRFGHPLSSDLIQAVQFDAPAPADSFALDETVRQGFAAAGARGLGTMRPGTTRTGPAEPVELAAGVVTTAGAYAMTFVEQPDGIVVLDAPMTSAWSAAVFDAAAARFPGKAVKLVVTTSDAWPHIGGLREFAARGVPIVALELNRPIVGRLLAAPRVRDADAWASAPRQATVRGVSDRTVIGSGPNRIELYPVAGEGGERMMVAWLPEHRVLYASDLVQIGPDGSVFWPEYLLEVAWVVERHALDPVTVFAMHTPPIPWTQFETLIEQTRVAVD